MNKPSTRSVATVTAALGLLTAMTIIAAGPAAAHTREEAGRPQPALNTLLVDAARAGEERSPERLLPCWRRLFASIVTGFDAVHEPVSTLGKSLASKGRLRAGARAFLPSEVVAFYDGLTDEDKLVLKEIADRHGEFGNEEQVLEALKGKTPQLHDKAAALRQLVQEKMDALNAPAKAFVHGVVARLKALMPAGDKRPSLMEISQLAHAVLEEYRALPDDAKHDLKENLPRLDAIIQEIRDVLA